MLMKLLQFRLQTRLSKPEIIKFRSDLGFNHINLILKKKAVRNNTIINSIFCRKNKAAAQSLRKWKSKNWHVFFWAWISSRNWRKRLIDRNQNKENERQIKIEKRLTCKLHRINPDTENVDIFVEISKIQN